jgi:hypothetical protein
MEVTALQQLINYINEWYNPSATPSLEDVLNESERLKELEKQQIIEFGEKMQIIKDVDFDGNVTFIFEPKTHFKETYGKANK